MTHTDETGRSHGHQQQYGMEFHCFSFLVPFFFLNSTSHTPLDDTNVTTTFVRYWLEHDEDVFPTAHCTDKEEYSTPPVRKTGHEVRPSK
jgi:hypothetical protein